MSNHRLDIHQVFQTALALSYDKGAVGMELTKLKYGTGEWLAAEELYSKISNDLIDAKIKFEKLLPYE